ncbi:MAG: DUF1987 domain-containing protein [Bacteroidales bacterium]|nr:DUF1987 domain-containing protein [Bacteroidales bacterium]
MLEPIKLNKKEDTPSVVLDKQESIFFFEGISIPEDSTKFYQPIIDWLNLYSQDPNDYTEVIFKIKYYNTSSSLQIATLIKIFDLLFNDGHKVLIKWHHHPQDEALKEDGEEFAEFFNVPFEIISDF